MGMAMLVCLVLVLGVARAAGMVAGGSARMVGSVLGSRVGPRRQVRVAWVDTPAGSGVMAMVASRPVLMVVRERARRGLVVP